MPEEVLGPEQVKMLDESLADLPLSNRTVNTLDKAGIRTVRELLLCCGKNPAVCRCNHRHVLHIDNIGEATMQEIYTALAKVGINRSNGKRQRKKK